MVEGTQVQTYCVMAGEPRLERKGGEGVGFGSVSINHPSPSFPSISHYEDAVRATTSAPVAGDTGGEGSEGALGGAVIVTGVDAVEHCGPPMPLLAVTMHA